MDHKPVKKAVDKELDRLRVKKKKTLDKVVDKVEEVEQAVKKAKQTPAGPSEVAPEIKNTEGESIKVPVLTPKEKKLFGSLVKSLKEKVAKKKKAVEDAVNEEEVAKATKKAKPNPATPATIPEHLIPKSVKRKVLAIEDDPRRGG